MHVLIARYLRKEPLEKRREKRRKNSCKENWKDQKKKTRVKKKAKENIVHRKKKSYTSNGRKNLMRAENSPSSPGQGLRSCIMILCGLVFYLSNIFQHGAVSLLPMSWGNRCLYRTSYANETTCLWSTWKGKLLKYNQIVLFQKSRHFWCPSHQIFVICVLYRSFSLHYFSCKFVFCSWCSFLLHKRDHKLSGFFAA